MSSFKKENLILESRVFGRDQIVKRLVEGGFSSIARFEQFIWDLELFLQLQKRLHERVILKGGAAAQFYIPIAAQRTSIDIDMICLATRDEVHEAISEIEANLAGEREYFRFRLHKPANPKLGLSELETYYTKVPSICDENELFVSRGSQEVKSEFLFSTKEYPLNKIKKPELFALETENEFNVLALEYLLADKLTTFGPTTIGISDDRADEQFKQIYDVITLMLSNFDMIIPSKERIRTYYERAAEEECQIRGIVYDPEQLFLDMKLLIDRIKNIENDSLFLSRAHDFQSLYLRKDVNRDKAQWAIVGHQLEMFIGYIFHDDDKILNYRELEKLSVELRFASIRGPERGRLIKEARDALKLHYAGLEGLSTDVFKKRLERIMWELASKLPYSVIIDSLGAVLKQSS